MVKLSLQCAIVGQAGSSFDVEIDDSAKVSKLKKEIKKENSDDPILKNVAPKNLRLFLAKTADGAWLDGAGAAAVALDETGAPVSRDQNGAAQGFKQMDPLLWINNDKHFGKNFGPAEGEVHVLVVIPPRERHDLNRPHFNAFVAEPMGPVIDLTSTGTILEFLESQMQDSTKVNTVPHLLPRSNRAFQLSGREMALNAAADCMRNISAPISETSRIDRKIPVCAGLSGLGKSRMLDEWKTIFHKAEIHEPHLGTLVVYYNGHMPVPIEKSMTIEASFSWRLLHRFFIEGNGEEFDKWFSYFLPKNGAQLRLRTTLEVICEKAHRLELSTRDETLHFFLGVDEYQSIKDVNGIVVTKDLNGNQGPDCLLQDLLNVLGNIMSSPVSGIRIYPMFAGTDLSAISIVNSSKTETLRLPMLLLSPTEVETAVASVPHGPSLLLQSPVRRHLFYLGGVPRWCFEYISLLLQQIDETGNDILSIEQIETAFFTIRSAYVALWGKNLDEVDFINLCAYSVAGVEVNESQKKIGGMSWLRAQDSSLCLLSECSEVLIPYAIFHKVANLTPAMHSEVERCFIKCVQGLIEKVDGVIYDKAPWALWEVFGAYFHALRINAMIIVEKRTVKVSELFRGALVKGCNDEVELVPTMVMEYDGKFGSSIEPVIGRTKNSLETYNWLTDGRVVINGENGKGVDIFFALKKNEGNGYVVCLDQRKRVAGNNLGSVEISNLLSAASIKPTALGNVYDPITVVPLVFSSLRSTNGQELTGQKCQSISDAVVVSYAQMKTYHHGLWLHPASSPCVNVNKDPVSYIKMVLTGSSKDIKFVATQITGRKRTFKSVEDFSAAVKKIRRNVKVSNQERIVFC